MYRFPNTDGYFIQHPQWIHAGPYQFEEVGSVVSVEEPNGAGQQQVVPTSRIGTDSRFLSELIRLMKNGLFLRKANKVDRVPRRKVKGCA